jgi:serine/threonine protein phosphatase PrpC
MNCPACGMDNRDGARFCRGCGIRLLADEELPAMALSREGEGEPAGEGQPHAAARSAPEAGLAEETQAVEMVAEKTAHGEAPPEGVAPEEVAAEAGLAEMPIGEPGPGAAKVETKPEAETDLKAKVGAEEEKGAAENLPEQASSEDEDKIPLATIQAEQPPMGEGVVPAAEAELLPEPEDEILTFWREEAKLMTPLASNTVIEDRYLVVEALDVQEDEILYLAHDLRRCWQCGLEDNDPEAAFCARCGVLMDRRPEVRLLEVPDAEAPPPSGKIVVARLSHEARHFLLLAEPEPGPEPVPEGPPQPVTVRLLVGQRTDPGQVRELDEDSLFVLTLSPTYESRIGPVLGLFVIADGMGGHAGGEVASRLALQVLVDHVMRSVILPELAGELVLEADILPLLRQATMAANDAVYLARQKRETDMGTTLTTALIRDAHLFLAHVGDSRIYRWNADGLEQLTTDHSVIARMIANGQAKPEELYTHLHRSVIYRCIGDKPLVDVDADLLPLAPGDRVIVCCDGLWEMIRDEGIDDVMMQEADPQEACDLMVQRANAAGGDDNISIIVVQVETMEELAD